MTTIFILYILLFNNYHLFDSIDKDIELFLIPCIHKNSVAFQYKIQNKSDVDVILNIASLGNNAFFTLSIADENSKEIEIHVLKYKINYSKVFERNKNYICIKAKSSIIRNYKTFGFNNLSRESIVKIELPHGKYKASLYYSMRKIDLKIENKNFEKMWYGTIESIPVDFIID